MNKSNIVLIGMPGAGKSTVGVVLAKQLAYDFLDTDLLIQTAEQRSLQEIVDQDGYMALRDIEERILLQVNVHRHVIATGGSAAYSRRAMCHLKSDGLVVFLDADLDTLSARIHNFASRGLAKRADQSLADLFRERSELYTRYADLTVKCAGCDQEEVSACILRLLK